MNMLVLPKWALYGIRSERKIKAFIIVGTYKPTARFIKLIKNEYPDANYYNLSFVGRYFLKNNLCGKNKTLCREYSENVYITGVVPDITDKTIPIVNEYQSALKKYNSQLEPNPMSLEGYIIAKIFAQALLNIKGEPTREKIIDSFENLKDIDVDLDFKMNYGKNKHQALEKVWFFKLIDGQWQGIE